MTINICSVVKIKMWIPHLLWCLREAHCLQGWWNRVCRLCSCTPTFWLLPLVIYLISFKTWVQKAPFASTLMTRLATLLILDGFSCFSQKCLQREWGNFPCTNWNGICWGPPLQLVQLIKIHFLPHLKSFMWEQKFEKNFFKKSPIQPPNGVLSICKLPFSNGSYRNGVCRALWALVV